MNTMRKLYISTATVVIAAGALVLGSGTAHAALVTGSFTGKVTSVQGADPDIITNININDLVTGNYSFNPFAPDTNIPRADTGNFKNSSGLMGTLSLTIGSRTWTSGDLIALIFDNRGGQDKFQLSFAGPGVHTFPGDAPSVGSDAVFVLLQNTSPPPELVTNANALPTRGLGTNPDQLNYPAGAPIARGKIATGTQPSGWNPGYRIAFNIDNPSFNMTPVPEPGTLLLIGSGLVGIGVGARRRNRK